MNEKQAMYANFEKQIRNKLSGLTEIQDLYVGECFMIRALGFPEDYREAHEKNKRAILKNSLCIVANRPEKQLSIDATISGKTPTEEDYEPIVANFLKLTYSLSDNGSNLDTISISPDLQKKGIGTLLVNLTAEFAKKIGASTITVLNKGNLYSRNSSEGNKIFWEKLGFVVPNHHEPLVFVKGLN